MLISYIALHYLRYVFYIRNKYIFSLSMFNLDLLLSVSYSLVLEFSLELKSFFSLIFILLKITFSGKSLSIVIY